MRRLLDRWLEALGEHIARHGWIDPTGVAPPLPPVSPTVPDKGSAPRRPSQSVR